MAVIAERITRVMGSFSEFDRFMSESTWAQHGTGDGFELIFGNPHEPTLPGFVAALAHWSTPRTDGWYGYALNRGASRKIIAESLQAWRGMSFEPADIFLTNGGFAAISVALAAITNPGDDIIFISPHWFLYEALIAAQGARPVSVPALPQTFDLDIDAIAAAITPRTKAIIINSPNNPTGVIYSPATLTALAQLLTDASARIGQPIYLISDEAYSRIVFDGQQYTSPLAFYPYSFLAYTYGKVLLTPGQRLGYVALPPTMPDREQLGEAIDAAQVATGFAYPNALLQHALPDLEKLSIDLAHLQRKRDRLVSALTEMGYDVQSPAGTFYLFPRAPWPDDWAFTELLAKHRVFCMPGVVVGAAGYFRISLTANDAMIEGALPGFDAARCEAASR